MNERMKEFQELIDAHTCKVTPEMELMREFKYREAKKESRVHKKSYSIVDLKEGRFAFHVSVHDKWLAAPVIDINEPNNLEHIYKLTHPDDLPKVIENELRGYYFLQDLSSEEKEEFQFLYMRRILDKNRNFQLCLHKVSVAEWDETGKPWLLQNCTEKLPAYFSDLSLIGDFYLIFPLPLPDRKKREIYVNKTWITEQELKILQLVFDGKVQQEIADILNISANTVKTHFTTIRKKLNVKTIQMAVEFAKLTGMLLMQLLFLWIECGEDIEELLSGY
jgi:DNA-binding CsgD family transcriptional regulator